MRQINRGPYTARFRSSGVGPKTPFTRGPRRSSLVQGRRLPLRLILAGIIVLISFVSYFGSRSVNPVTGRAQHVAMSVDQEIVLGLQAAPEMLASYGGESRDAAAQALLDRVGARLLSAIDTDHPWNFDFHLLADQKTVNAFALPGGQVFITRALFDRLETEGQLAGVIGHEIGHVIERHGAQQLAKQNLTQGLVSATGVAADSYDAARLAQAVGSMVNMKYGRDDELESDAWGVELLSRAGYDPRALVGVMRVLAQAGGGSQPEFFSTHPNPDHRTERIEAAIRERFPAGVPDGLDP